MTFSQSDLNHNHTFNLDKNRHGESRTVWVFVITAVMMIVEIAGGLIFGSMALLADGLHMGSHATAMGIAVIAYVYARKHAEDRRFSFGTGKVNSLAAFTSALLLAIFSVMMAKESIERIIHPVQISFDQAILVTVIGFIVNLVCVFILGDKEHSHEHGHHDGKHGEDQNLKAAYIHVLADTMTSVFAIVALLAGKYFGINWLDPVMGIAGSILVATWALGLLRDTSRVLLDYQAPPQLYQQTKADLEAAGAEVVYLHMWSIGPGLYSLAACLVSPDSQGADYFKAQLPQDGRIVHTTIEVHRSQ